MRREYGGRKAFALLQRRRGLGKVAEADVVAQEAALAQVEQSLPPLRKHLDQTRGLLAARTGGFPSNRLSQRFELAAKCVCRATCPSACRGDAGTSNRRDWPPW
jgi:outer membrane protein TolC